MFALISFIVSIIGLTPMLLGGGRSSTEERIKITVILGVIYFVFNFIMLYLCLPSLAYPLYGAVIALLLIEQIVSAIVNPNIIGFGMPASIVLILLGCSITYSGCFNSYKYASLIGKISDKSVQKWTQEIEPVDPTHLRLVPEATAIALAKTSLNQNATNETQTSVGSQFNIDEEHITLQKVKDKLIYVIPLDYRSFSTYQNTNGIPGYIVVDACNPQAKPVYYNKYIFKYSPQSYFSHNLERHLWVNGYSNKILSDYSFELDDDYNPHWVITVSEPTIGWNGEIVNGVVIVDPLTGNSEFKDVKNVYTWVDRVYPLELIHDYIKWYGSYQLGWWNSFWAQLNIKKPEYITLNYGIDGKCYYVTPLTSNNNDASMTDLIYTDTRTGESKKYIVSGTTEDNLITAVTSKLSYQHLHGNSIIYENVFGRMTAIISVLGEDGSYRGAAFIDVTNKSIISYDISPLNSLRIYQNLLSQNGEQISTDNSFNIKHIISIINRMNYETTSTGLQLDFYIDSIPHSFYVNCSQFESAKYCKIGDNIEFSYNNTDASVIYVNSFNNKAIKILSSDNQKSVEKQNVDNKSKENMKSNTDDFKDNISKMSPHQIDSFIQRSKSGS